MGHGRAWLARVAARATAPRLVGPQRRLRALTPVRHVLVPPPPQMVRAFLPNTAFALAQDGVDAVEQWLLGMWTAEAVELGYIGFAARQQVRWAQAATRV